jgi:hypothetical protein
MQVEIAMAIANANLNRAVEGEIDETHLAKWLGAPNTVWAPS